MSGVLDRRSLIALGVAAGARLALPAVAGAASQPTESEVLRGLLITERLTISTIVRVLPSPHLGHAARAAAERVLAAEREHSARLEQTLREIGVKVPRLEPMTVSALDRALLVRHVHRRLNDLHSEHDCLDLLLALEGLAEGALYRAMPLLSTPAHQRLAAGLMASEAQHEAILGLLRDPKNFDRAAPYAFVEGFGP